MGDKPTRYSTDSDGAYADADGRWVLFGAYEELEQELVNALTSEGEKENDTD